jgi:hypothetical protein
MNTATAVLRITASASAVALGMALAGCQSTRSEESSDSSGSSTASTSSSVRDDLSPMQARQMAELFRLQASTVDDDLSPTAPRPTVQPSSTPADDVIVEDGVDDDLSPISGR